MIRLVVTAISSIVVLARPGVRFPAVRVRLSNRTFRLSRNRLDVVLDRVLNRPPGMCHCSAFQLGVASYEKTGAAPPCPLVVTFTRTPYRMARELTGSQEVDHTADAIASTGAVGAAEARAAASCAGVWFAVYAIVLPFSSARC